MKIAVAKAERRYTEDGKDTIFFHRGDFIPPAKVQNWKRRIMVSASSPLNPNAKTPVTIAYFTPVSCVVPISPVRELMEVDDPSALGSSRPKIDYVDKELNPLPADQNTFISLYFPGRAFLRCFVIDRGKSPEAVERQGMTFRFLPKFISGMFASKNLDEYLIELYEILLGSFQFAHFSSWLGPFEDCGPVALTDQLGQALIRNHDLPKAAILAAVLDKALKNGKQVDEIPFQDHLLARWHRDQGFYEASRLISADAQLPSDGSDGALGNFANATRKLLQNSYQQQPESGCFQNDVQDAIQEAALEARSGEFERADRIFNVLLALTPNFLAHVMDPRSLAEMHLTISNCYKSRLSKNGCEACISLSPANRSYDEASRVDTLCGGAIRLHFG
ncbi:uncharacterized protein PAC_10668 [Phialocephala subalpina]|uniref:Uncharacterized protein n=1 Tax=Phialocephala subalpina TaxID=576137 RepID=A0A1L7X6Z6_9HELO|nr:uncharacterized protein PAC_10668 [Phialocephala subalpina]